MSPQIPHLAPSSVLRRLRIVTRWVAYVTAPRMTKQDWDEYPARITYALDTREERDAA